MKLQPQSVSAPVGAWVKFNCSYRSAEKLFIQFDETHHPNDVMLPSHGPSPLYIREWGSEQYLVTRITPYLNKVTCRVTNIHGETLGSLSAMIYPGGTSKHLS